MEIYQGVLPVSWLTVFLLFWFFSRTTLCAVSLYLHRSATHYAVWYHPVVKHFFRFWLWLTTGMRTKEWVAVHRKHHANVESEDDPHSPVRFGIWRVLFLGWLLYSREAKNKETLDTYGKDTPNDWVERWVYTPTARGVWILGLTLLIILFGVVKGPVMFLLQASLIPLLAAGVINGGGHHWGYRNFETPDNSRNIISFAYFIFGEELHNNHHEFPSSARFSKKKWEFDYGWVWIKILAFLRLAKIKRAV